MLKKLVGPVVRPAPLLVVVFALVSCGGESSKGSVGGALPGCAQAGTKVDLPAGLANVPLPEGSVIDGTRKDAAGNTIYQGYVPGDVSGAKDYFETELPKAGYDVGEGDSEDHEAEMEFDGHDVAARLKVHDIDGCAGALTLAIAKKGNQ
ncbi:MAG: hypothetical protein QOE13_2857 [Gaiellaceae bacterium]|jgi:hypothetical protein|nr:hypothetical protein [Gaiellaceae bacterium]